jgi:hypothetical protein
MGSGATWGLLNDWILALKIHIGNWCLWEAGLRFLWCWATSAIHRVHDWANPMLFDALWLQIVIIGAPAFGFNQLDGHQARLVGSTFSRIIF